MADTEQNLSLADALTEPPPQIEEEVKRDFMASLEAEKFDDVIGEKVGKTDYVPLLDDEDGGGGGGPKAESQEAKAKPWAENLPRERPSATGPAAVVENGDHGLEGNRPEPSGKISEEAMSYKEFFDHNDSWTMDDGRRCFESPLGFEPMDVTGPYGTAELSEHPSLGFTHPTAVGFEPLSFLGAGPIPSRAAPFRPMAPPPEDFWFAPPHLAEGQGPAPFFQSPEAPKVPVEVEKHHPGGDEIVFSGELSPPEAEQAVSTVPPAFGAALPTMEELMGFQPSLDPGLLLPEGTQAGFPVTPVSQELRFEDEDIIVLPPESCPTLEKPEEGKKVLQSPKEEDRRRLEDPTPIKVPAPKFEEAHPSLPFHAGGEDLSLFPNFETEDLVGPPTQRGEKKDESKMQEVTSQLSPGLKAGGLPFSPAQKADGPPVSPGLKGDGPPVSPGLKADGPPLSPGQKADGPPFSPAQKADGLPFSPGLKADGPPLSPAQKADGPPVSPAQKAGGSPLSPAQKADGPPHSPIQKADGPPLSPAQKADGSPVSPGLKADRPPLSPAQKADGPPVSPAQKADGPPVSPAQKADGPPVSPELKADGPPLSPVQKAGGPPGSPAQKAGGPPFSPLWKADTPPLSPVRKSDRLPPSPTQPAEKAEGTSPFLATPEIKSSSLPGQLLEDLLGQEKRDEEKKKKQPPGTPEKLKEPTGTKPGEHLADPSESMGSVPGETPQVGPPGSVVEEPPLVKAKEGPVHPVEPSPGPEEEVKASAELPSAEDGKEFPPSPDKKTKPSAAAATGAKPAPAKSKAGTAGVPPAKRPASATLGVNKKTAAPGTGPTAAAPTPKRPSSGLARPSSLTPRELKPKGTDGKSPDKKVSPSKTPSATTPRTGGKTTPGGSRPTGPAATVGTSPGPRSSTAAIATTAVPPKKTSAVKTDVKAADAKKAPAKSPTADPSRPRSAPASTTASPALPGLPAGRPKPKPASAKPPGMAGVPAEPKKPSSLASKTLPKTSPGASKPPRPTASVSVPDLKNIRSKIGSTDNIKYQPGGGKAKLEKKGESALAGRKLELGTVSKAPTNKSTVSKESLAKSPNGKVQILSKKVNYSHVQSKCGSKDNIKHMPGGGNVQNVPKPPSGNKTQPRTTPKPSPGCTNVQILNKKIDLSKVASKCGSKTNIKHKPGGGDVKIENQKLNFKEKAQAKIEGGKEAAPENGGPPSGSSAPQENGAGPLAPAQGGGDQREIQSFNTHIQETN